jgi:hypothetical protein
MYEDIYSFIKENNKVALCIECLLCKTIKGKFFCKNKNFSADSLNEIVLYTPIDFDCTEFEES